MTDVQAESNNRNEVLHQVIISQTQQAGTLTWKTSSQLRFSMEYRLLTQTGALKDNGRFDADECVSTWGAPQEHNRLEFSEKEQLQLLQLLNRGKIPREVLDSIPESICRENQVLPLALKGETIFVASTDDDDLALRDKLCFLIKKNVRFIRTPRELIASATNRLFGENSNCESVDSMLSEFTETAVEFTSEKNHGERTSLRTRNELRKPQFPVSGREKAIVEFKPGRVSPGLRPGTPFRTSSSMRLGMFYCTIPDGTRVLITRRDGTRDVLVGPKRVWIGHSTLEPMDQHIAQPGDYLIIRNRDGRQEHLSGPAEVWFDPRVHHSIEKSEGLQVASKEAVIVYSYRAADQSQTPSTTTRRLEYGPTVFIPKPGEWLHTFSWHSSKGGAQGVEKIPNGLVFQKLWLMPDQMYHDVHDVRTSDDAVLTIRLMIFFELTDIERMLDASHDPIGDFVNAATADVVEFTGHYDFESFKTNTNQLNDLATYKQLSSRANQIGYRIHAVVYRGYGAAKSLQEMHEKAIEARTKLQLDRATEEQAQELESYRLESQLTRATKRRSEQVVEVKAELENKREKAEAELKIRQQQQNFAREQLQADSRVQDETQRLLATQQQAHLQALQALGVDLTAFLTQHRADKIFEFRGPSIPHVHLEPPTNESGRSSDSSSST